MFKKAPTSEKSLEGDVVLVKLLLRVANLCGKEKSNLLVLGKASKTAYFGTFKLG